MTIILPATDIPPEASPLLRAEGIPAAAERRAQVLQWAELRERLFHLIVRREIARRFQNAVSKPS